MSNLLQETIVILKENGKSLDDVSWYGTSSLVVDTNIKDFLNVNYNDSYGASEIATDLIIVGKDFWLTRGEYDGSEWWIYNSKPKKPKTNCDYKYVKGGLWDKLESINEED